MLTTIKVYECYAVKFHENILPKNLNMGGTCVNKFYRAEYRTSNLEFVMSF